MQRVTQMRLNGHSVLFPANEDAYDLLWRYLERARLNLKDDPDHEEVIGDLEQSIGEKFLALLGSDKQVISLADVNIVLAEMGPVGPDSIEANLTAAPSRTRRRLYRIKEGQDIFGVCQGLSAYADIDVDWVRLIFFGLAVITGGLFILVYFTMALLLPVVSTRAEYAAVSERLSTSQAIDARGADRVSTIGSGG